MPQFADAREAKEFLVAEIVRQAEAEKVELSDVERKMLYFSESGWTLPDMPEVNAAFQRDYDIFKYEAKIARLMREIRMGGAKDPQLAEAWGAAIHVLGQEDHYLLAIARRDDATPRPPRDLWKLWATGLAIVLLLTLFIFLTEE